MHDQAEMAYKVINLYADEKRYIYFISDVPHLLKTTRNCFSNSFGHSFTRKLWVGDDNMESDNMESTFYSFHIQFDKQYISWQHIVDRYDKNKKGESKSVVEDYMKYEHVALNSYSKMRVDLAAEVCSAHACVVSLISNFLLYIGTQ